MEEKELYYFDATDGCPRCIGHEGLHETKDRPHDYCDCDIEAIIVTRDFSGSDCTELYELECEEDTHTIEFTRTYDQTKERFNDTAHIDLSGYENEEGDSDLIDHCPSLGDYSGGDSELELELLSGLMNHFGIAVTIATQEIHGVKQEICVDEHGNQTENSTTVYYKGQHVVQVEVSESYQ
ncbi:MAG: hypothetical protein EP338_06120 [Bacteroidetes bacterium]|nr:MAG: hypothetical protein EP338_06120 [Bacteroidota bacterium]